MFIEHIFSLLMMIHTYNDHLQSTSSTITHKSKAITKRQGRRRNKNSNINKMQKDIVIAL